MAWQCSGDSQAQLVRNLRRGDIITSDAVEAAMLAVDRKNYVPIDQSDSAYQDSPLPIGYRATISAPHMHAMCLEQLLPNLKPGANVLDVGSGSGYLTAVMAHMISPSGHVYGVEHIPELVEFSKRNLMKEDSKLASLVTFQATDGRLGYPDKAPYDAIHVGAASPHMPSELIKQLKVGGRMIVPVGPSYGAQYLYLVEKVGDDEVRKTALTGVMYVPLTDAKKQIH